MKTSLFALTCALAATSPALAEDEPQSTGWTPEIIVTGVRDGYDVPAATSATRVATPVEKIPQSIQSLTRQLIEDQDLQNLTDALVNVSGIVPTSQGQAVLQPTLVRGFKVNYFIDGIPTYQLPEGAADPATLVFVDRIEVVKGPTSTLYGGGAGAPLSGLINLVSRDPSTTNLLMNAGLRAGSFNSWGGDADINLPIGAMAAFRVSGMVESADSFIDFVTMDRFGIFPSLLVKLGPDTRLVVRGRYNKIEQTEYAGLPVELIKPNLVIDRNVFAGARDAPRTSVENKAITGTLTHSFSDGVQAELSINRTLNKFDEWATFPYGQIAGTVYNFGSARLPSDTQKTYTTGTVTAKLGDAAIRQTLLAGVDYDETDYYARLDFNVAWGVVDFANPLPAGSFGAPPPIFYDQRDRMKTIAIFAQDQVSIGERLDLTLGLRWTRLKIASDLGLFGATEESSSKVTPRAGLTYRIADGVSLFAGYSEGFQGVVGGAFYGLTPKPETSQAWEAGIKLNAPIKGLTGTAALYQVTRQNVLTAIPNSFFYSQDGEQRACGAELDLIYEPTPSLSLLFNYAYTDAKVTMATTIPVGARLRAVPRHSARLAGRYRFQSGALKGLEAGAGMTIVSERELTLPNSVAINGSTLVDAQASYDLGPVRLGVSIVNLLGSKAFAPYQYLGGAYVTPVQPRSAFVTLRAGF
ncbi:TonB-dependent receptor [Sphingobium sp.]|uniref:TonB-dependent siderophore receptor n=1 Tax=Sphingobium sp. TaxID=1912891 RepID=UPI000C3FB9FA|nr:TonB-dependent receptor [Sphingobium sp.]MBS88083.1 TonB-dependent siderophore receptor [Sphingobium sp.]